MVKAVCLTFLEVTIIILLTKYFGGWFTFVLFALPTLTGLLMLWCRRNNYQSAVTKHESAVKDRSSEESLRLLTQPEYATAQAEITLHWITLFSLLIPGLLSTIYAFHFMLPTVRKSWAIGFQKASELRLEKLQSKEITSDELPQ